MSNKFNILSDILTAGFFNSKCYKSVTL